MSLRSARSIGQFPMSAAQRGIFFAHEIAPDAPMSVAAYLEFHDPIDNDALAEAVRRTAYETESAMVRVHDDDDLAIEIDHSMVTPLHLVDLSDDDDPRATATALMDLHRSRRVDLRDDRLLEAYSIRLAPDHHIFYCWGNHLAFDGFAATIMFARVGTHYAGIVAGRDVPDSAAMSLQDIEALDAQYRASTEFTDDHDYWQQRLADPPEHFTLSDRENVPSAISMTESATLPAEVTEQVRSAATTHGVRVASIFTAGFGVYLAALGGRDDMMLSLPVAARQVGALRESAGMTSNVLPIPLSTRPGATIADVVAATNAEIKGAVRHQRYRHEDISREFFDDGAGISSRGFFGPMVNVMLFLNQMDFGTVMGDVHLLSTGPVDDLSLNVYEGLDGVIRVDLEANPHMYSSARVREHLDRFLGFLQRFITADASTLIGRIDVADPAEMQRVVVEFNRTEVDTPPATLLDLLDTGRTIDPSALAVRDGTLGDEPGDGGSRHAEASRSDRTFDELHCAANQLARRLIAAGAGPESVVAVMMPRSVDLVTALVAVVETGAAFLPIDPADPSDRVHHILDTARPLCVLVDADLDLVSVQALSAQHSVDVVPVDPTELSQYPDDPLDPSEVLGVATADTTAYVLFTSGSTGRPKGVAVSNAALVNRLQWMQGRYDLGPTDNVLQKTPATFDVSVWEFFWPLSIGATLVVAAPDGHRDPWYLYEAISQWGITVIHFVPSMLAAFGSAISQDPQAGASGELSSLRMVFTSGEALAPSTVARFAARSDAPVHNLYGPTEAAIDVTHADHCDPRASSVPIGSPVWNTEVFVLDTRLRPAPIGVVGELYLSGVQLARGYVARPDLTSERFVANPFRPDGARMYRTGDLVRWRADGALDYIGRTDFQVKIRGQRLELGEVESALAHLPGVGDCVVIARTDGPSGAMLVGYATAEPGARLDPVALRSAMADALPAFMVPTAIVVLDILPTTSNGKLDRRALPSPELRASTPDDGSAVPDGPLETVVAAAYAEVLGLDVVPMTTTFFEVGGNSLLATQLTSRLGAVLGRRIGIKAVYDAPSPRDMVAWLRADGVDDDHLAGRVDAGEPVSGNVEVRPRPDRIPLSPAQQRVWFLNRLDPSSGSYNIPFRLGVAGDLDVDALVHAFGDLVTRHEALRTLYPSDATGPHQHITTVDFAEHVEVVDGPPGTPARDTVGFASRGFDLTTQLPIRVRVVRVAADETAIEVVLHHIAADGWSLRPLAADLSAAYEARAAGAAPEWSPLPVQYADYTLWQRDRLGDENDPASPAARQIDYWSRQLADIPAEAELPTDRPRSSAPTMGGATTTVSLNAAIHSGLRVIAADAGVGMFMVIHALVAVLLRRMSSEGDIVVGTPVAGRGDRDLDAMIGMFVNTLVLTVAVDKQDSFLEVLGHCRDVDVEALDNADVPFERIVDAVNPTRADNRHPLFQISVALEDTRPTHLTLGDLAVVAEPIDTGLTKFDLGFTAEEHLTADGRPDGVTIRIDYATDLFDRTTVTEIGTRLRRLARGMAAEPRTPIGDIPVLQRHERFALVPAAGRAGATPRTFVALISEAVSADPDAVAVRFRDESVTYADLDARSNKLARSLIKRGVGVEQFVAIEIGRSVEWVVAMWAVAKTGAAWIPVDPRYPAERIDYMLDDSQATIVLTATAAVSHRTTATVLDITAIPSDADDSPVTDSERIVPISVDNPAYLIYTSGTTGNPKGVVISHRGLVNFSAEQLVRFKATPRSRTLQFASPSFDASILETLLAVGASSTMVIVPPEVLGGNELEAVMRSERVTHAFLTPSVLGTISTGLPDLEVVIIGGEAANPEIIGPWARDHRLFNAYGPTEATVVATISEAIEPGDTPTIGGPIRGMDLLVLDERLVPVPPGTIGELYLSGAHLARGYHGRRQRTSGVFVANPYSETGERMYRTGDLVRWNGDNDLEYVGRNDSQVKVRGFRIELGEVEAALVRHDDVGDAVSVTRTGSDGTAYLVAYITPAQRDGAASLPASALDTRAIGDAVAAALPAHMVPRVLVPLDAIPVTASGKVDHRALPEPESTTDVVVEPRTDAERIVAAIFAEVLALDPAHVGRDAAFFDVGGNSLMGTQVVAAIEERIGEKVAVRALFDNPTVAGLAAVFAEKFADGAVHTLHVGITPTTPLVRKPGRPDVGADGAPAPAQQRLWFLNQLEPESGAYNIAFVIELTGALDQAAIAAALADVVDRHEPLRTIYPATDGVPHTVVVPAAQATPVLEPVDVTDARTAQDELARSTFDLRVDTPLRAALHRIGEDKYELALVIHHIAADGWSLGPLARDIAVAYRARHESTAPAFAELPVRYRDYADWQLDTLGEVGDPDSRVATVRRWWVQNLAGIPARSWLPVDRVPGAAVEQTGSGTVDFDLTAGQVAAMRVLAREHDASLFMAVHAVLAVVLARMSTDPEVQVGGADADIVIGTPVAGRSHSGLADLVGMFVNSVVLRTPVPAHIEFTEFLARVREADVDALSRSEIPFEQLVEAVNPDRSGGRHPLFQVVLAFAEQAPAVVEIADVAVTTREIQTGAARFDLELRVTGSNLRFTYARDLFDAHTVVDLAERFVSVVEQVLADPYVDVADLAVLGRRERAELVPLRSPEVPDAPITLARMLSDAAATAPDATAIVEAGSGRTVTYAELDERSNQWARLLIVSGVGPDDVVAVASERSVESLTAVWAVAKSGAGFLPVDPGYPIERIEHMVSDSAATLGFTTVAHRDALPPAVRWIAMDAPSGAGADAPERSSIGSLVASFSSGPIAPRSRIRPLLVDSIAYVIYTSGSTGTPKGVAVTHRGLASLSTEQRTRYGVEADSRILYFASPSFDASVLELLLAISASATLISVPAGVYGGDELAGVMREHGVTHGFVTPAALATVPSEDLPALRAIAMGGEAPTDALVEAFARDDRTVLNAYGPTETTIVAVMDRLTVAAPIAIGTPVRGMDALVLDHEMRAVPTNVPGELYLRGAGVARGYLGRAGLTASRFVADPLGSGAVVYRTGDIVSHSAVGRLRYHGRNDDQVKVRGFRVELGEVDAALMAHPDVVAAVSDVRGDGADAVLLSWVRMTGRETPQGLRKFVQSTVPRHLVPTAITVVDAIPRTPNGKVDRAALPAPVFGESETGRRVRGTVERHLAEVIAHTLHRDVDSVGAEVDFFDLGGTSLLATQLISAINTRFGSDLRVRAIFDNPTVAELAAVLGPDAAPVGPVNGSGDDATDLMPRPIDDDTPIPLSLAQRRLWFINRSDPASPAYNVPFAMHFTGTLDIGSLRTALIDVLTRHVCLRMRYPHIDGAPLQQPIADADDVIANPVDTVDCEPDLVGARVIEFARIGFDLEREAPLRVRVIRSGPTEHTVVLVVHHIAADGWSLPTLVDDLLVAYRARTAGQTPGFADLAVDYLDYSLWQLRAIGAPDDPRSVAARQIEFWRAELGGAAPESTLPTDRPRPQNPTMDAATVTIELDADLRTSVNEVARAVGGSSFMVLHAALAVLANRMGAGDDVVIGTPIAGRSHPELASVVGMFVNTLALRTRVDPSATIRDLLRELRDRDLEALANTDVPFDDVVAALNPERVIGRHPVFQTALSVHEWGSDLSADPQAVSDSLEVSFSEIDSATAKFDLQFTVTGIDPAAPRPARLELTYATDLYDRSSAEGFAERYVTVLRALVAGAADGDTGTTTRSQAVGDIIVTDAAEVVTTAPARGRPAPAARTFAELVDAAVSDNPDGYAAIDRLGGYTYRELDEHSNRLARHLLAEGVTAESVVAMAIPRSALAMAVIWAIVKTGAAYLPVDPTYPQARIEHMLDDSGTTFGVTDVEHVTALGDRIRWVTPDAPQESGRINARPGHRIGDDERAAIRPGQLAYMIYTSGSTGRPKGVLVTHGGLVGVHDELGYRMGPDRHSRVLHFASPSFDASVLEMVMALAGRSTLVIVPTDVFGGDQLTEFLARSAVSHAFITPAALASVDPARTPALRHIAVGGEAFGSELVRRWSDGRVMYNVYGPTEATIISTCSEPMAPDARIDIGTPNRGVRAQILDARLHPTARGVVGELYLMGGNLTRGYHGQSGLTSSRFVANPIGAYGERMYRTGDLVRWTGERTIEYVGRSDHQVQVRGFRIELGEIDAVLVDHPGVDFAVTVVTGSGAETGDGADEMIVSYVVADDAVPLDAIAVRDHAAQRLPRHMVPTVVMPLDTIPLTPTGKLDRTALAAPAAVARRSADAARAPRAGTETAVVEVFADVLGDVSVSVDDGFFELGGNSLLATKVVSVLRERHGYDVAVAWLFTASTPADLARRIDLESARTRAGDTGGTDADAAAMPVVLPLRGAPTDTGADRARPLFAIHPAVGLSWSYTSVLPYLPADRPFYGLQNPVLSGEPAAAGLSDLARRYVREIQALQPQGPYHLMGWSLGGLIAQEMAVILTETGHEVATLMLLDSYVVADREGFDEMPTVADLAVEFGVVDADRVDPAMSLTDALTALRVVPGPLSDLTLDQLERLFAAYRHATSLAGSWLPRTYEGDAVFVTATQDPPPGPPAVDDWTGRITGPITEIRADSTHAHLLDPDTVSVFTDELTDLLERNSP